QESTVQLASPKASFSQSKYDVSNAIDGNPKTGWAIAPKFKSAHWAEFQLSTPISLTKGETLSAAMHQHFGRGRVIGRPKVSFRIGPTEASHLDDDTIELLLNEEPLTKKQMAKLREAYVESNPALARVEKQISRLQSELEKIRAPSTLVMVELEQPRESYIMMRGDYLAKGDAVKPATPGSLHPMNPELPPNRLGLAYWLTDRSNPLMARVTVNRFWLQLFGRGIVSTPEDFGTQSDDPSHPELLDWLALEFQNQDWSVKSLIKQIVMSATFRQDSAVSDSLLRLDPENRLLGRGPRFRMPAEMIRDNALSIAGLLSDRSDGPPIMPYQPEGIWKAVGRGQPKWQEAVDADRFRRGIYVVWKRAAPYPSFVTFDAPDRASCTVRRPRTNTPMQALVLMNDQAYAEAAVGLAQRMIRDRPSEDPVATASFGFELATAQAPSRRVVDVLLDVYRSELSRIEAKPDLIKQRCELLPKAYRDSSAPSKELAAWFAVASVLLNLDMTITVN
ncbi:MAG: DUF1553 domain-containing protein, partial [Planctomycetota bacterium]